MTARGRFVARLMTMLMALAAFVTLGAGPAAAGNSGTVQYVALGDSYAAGQGGGEYLNDCLESPNGYPYLLDSKMRIDLRANAACTGASTSEVISTQLSKLNKDTELVTLTVGAADLDLSGVYRRTPRSSGLPECHQHRTWSVGCARGQSQRAVHPGGQCGA